MANYEYELKNDLFFKRMSFSINLSMRKVGTKNRRSCKPAPDGPSRDWGNFSKIEKEIFAIFKAARRTGVVLHVSDSFRRLFARFGLSLYALRNWEQGKRQRAPTARTHLTLIAKAPETIRSVLT